MTKIHLEVLAPETQTLSPQEDPSCFLPTGKPHVSYSEISDWMDCSERHRLKHVLKIALDKPSVHTEFGRAVHDAMEGFIKTRVLPDPVATKVLFEELCVKLDTDHGVKISDKERDSFSVSIPSILESVPKFLDEEFPGWEGVEAEHALYELISGQDRKYFKGFIDSVIRIPKKKRIVKKTGDMPMRLSEMAGATVNSDAEGWEYWIMDWKTSSWGWAPEKKRDFQKHLQLALYKSFYCKVKNLALDQVKCGFVLLKRTPRKSDGSCVELIPVSVGPKTEEKAVGILNNMINQVRSGRALKNRMSCRFCAYHGTPHCV